MSNIGFATLSVIPSAKGFGAALSGEVDPQMDAAGTSGGSRFHKAMGAGLLIGAAAIAAAVGSVLKVGIGEAMDASAGTAQLEAGIKSTGGAANVSADQMNALASSIQGYSGQTDDSIVAAQSLLLTFTNIKNDGPDKIFDQATVAAANMAAKLGGDAAGSATMLGKALNDPTKGMTALNKAGIQFTDAQKASIAAMQESGDMAGAQKIILGELETQFGGAAAAAGQSLPGQLEIAKRSFEDVSQAVVTGLLPLVLPAITSIGTTLTTTVIPAVMGFVDGFVAGTGAGGTFRDILTTVGSVLATVAGFLQQNISWLLPLAGFIAGVVIAMQIWTAVQTVFNFVMAANPIAIVIIAIAALVAGIVWVATQTTFFQDTWTAVWGVVQSVASAVGDFLSGLWVTISTAVTTAWTAIGTFLTGLWTTISTGVTTAWNAIKDFVGTIPGLILNFFMTWTLPGIIASHWDEIMAAAHAMWDGLVAWVGGIPGRFVAGLSALGSMISTVASTAWTAFQTAVSTGVDAVVTFVTGVPGKIVTGIGSLTEKLKSAGGDLLQGLINGITNKVTGAVQAVKDAVTSVINGAKNLLGINSPSTVFRSIGQYTAEGLEIGIRSRQGAVEAAMNDLVSLPTVPNLNANVTGPQNGIGPTSSTTTTASTGATSADIRALAESFRVALADQARTIQQMQRSLVGAGGGR